MLFESSGSIFFSFNYFLFVKDLTSIFKVKPFSVTLLEKAVVSGTVSNWREEGTHTLDNSTTKSKSFVEQFKCEASQVQLSVSSPASSCWADKQPWDSSSAWAAPPAGASLWCRGVCSRPIAWQHMEGVNEMKAAAQLLIFSHLAKQDAQGDGEQ